MALTKTSTQQNASDQLNDNLQWDNDVTKAELALEAVRWLLFNRGFDITQGPDRITFETLKTLEAKLEKFVSAVGTNASTGSAPFVRARPL